MTPALARPAPEVNGDRCDGAGDRGDDRQAPEDPEHRPGGGAAEHGEADHAGYRGQRFAKEEA